MTAYAIYTYKRCLDLDDMGPEPWRIVKFDTEGERDEWVADETTYDGRWRRFAATEKEVVEMLEQEAPEEDYSAWKSWVEMIGSWAFGEDGNILAEYE